MTIDTNIELWSHHNADNKILVSASFGLKENSFMSRDNITEVGHNGGEVVYHPTIEGLVRTGENHILTRGTIKLIFDLYESVTEEHIDSYINYIKNDLTGSSVVYDDNSRCLEVTYTAEYSKNYFGQLPAKYTLPANAARMEFSEGSDLFCILRVDGEPDAWTVEHTDATEEAQINKVGETCYIIFSTPVMANGKELVAAKPYKMTSSSITVTPSEGTKIVRLYRD
jgi:hypothetical protein